MSPLLLVGILATALADVSHIPQESTHPSANPQDINSLAYQPNDPKNFWWMADDSALKGAVNFFKECSSKGNCLTQPGFDKGSNDDGLGSIDLAKNPFLNGEIKSKSKSVLPTAADEQSIDLANNPFLTGAIGSKNVPSSFASNGEKVHNEHGFLGVQPKKPGFATSHPLSNKKPFPTSPPIGQESFVLGDDEGKVDETKCNSKDHVCITKELCINGLVNQKLVREITNKNVCNFFDEVCCRITDIENSPKIEIILSDSPNKNYASNINDLIHSSKFSSSTAKPTRSVKNVFGATPDYSDVNFDSNVRFASTIQGPGYLPPVDDTTPEISTYNPVIPITTARPCPSGSYLTASGSCQSPCPFGTIKKADGTCESTKTPQQCPPGTYESNSGHCEISCPYGTVKQIDGSCKNVDTPTPCPFGTYKSPSGQCIYRTTSALPLEPCPVGTIRKFGTCESIVTPRPCPTGTYKNSFGQCVTPTRPTPRPCPIGSHQSASGQCIYPTTAISCQPGTYKSAFGECIAPSPSTPTCPFGTVIQKDGSCKRPEIVSTPRPCGPGTFLGSSGSCVTITAPPRPCPPGTHKSTSGQCILNNSTTEICPFGTIRQTNGICKKPEPSPTPYLCGPGTFLTPSGICKPHESAKPCQLGTYKSSSGQCIPLSTQTTTIKTCPPGTYSSASGLCIAPPTPPQTCPFGTIKQTDGSCKPPLTLTPILCPSGTYKSVSGQCIQPTTSAPPCSFGTIRQIDGSCKTPEPVVTCPPGTYKSFSGECIKPETIEPPEVILRCPFGTVKQIDGTCKKELETSTHGYEYSKPCPSGQVKTASGECECPFGKIKQFDGSCGRPEQPCPPGTYREASGQCSSPTTPTSTCVFGTIRQLDGSCVKPTTSREYLPPTITAKPTEPTGYLYERPTSTVPDIGDNTGDSANDINSYFVRTNNKTTPVGCAAALKCVNEIYCTADGFVSPVPVVLTPQQELLRAPTTECRDLQSGTTGKCCRDPNYKDPWPSANLVNGVDDGQYKEDNFYGQREINRNRLVRAPNPTRSSRRATRRSEKYELQTKCGVRNLDTEPKGESRIDANFAEYPWQAMILRDSNRSLLCGGAIIRENAVLTAAHCVEGLETSDILIKGGEWKLGIDEEPLPFQIVKVAAILRHPQYKPRSYVNDLAVLVLQEKLRVAKNIGTICLPQPNQIPTINCKATGWGKRILQLHAKGALMHHIDVNIMDTEQCRQKLSNEFKQSEQNYSPNTLCGFSDIDQCKVDYGSALACANEQGQYTLSGIYSWDTGCKQDGQIGGYVAPDVEWIERTLRKSRKELRRLDREYLLKSEN